MSIEHVLNLCDAMEFYIDTHTNISSKFKKIYIGSYFCDSYYCNSSEYVWHNCFEFAKKHNIFVVLVIPTPSQRYLSIIKTLTSKLISKYNELINEVVVNDVAMLQWIAEEYPDKFIWLGRIMDKEIRDPRYSYFVMHKKIYEQVSAGLFKYNNIIGIETDNMNMNGFKVSNYCLAIHTPYVYLTMGRICELASVGVSSNEKYQMYRSCNRQCKNNWILYEQMSTFYLKHGRAVYVFSKEVPNIDKYNNIRIIESILPYKVAKD